MNIPRNRIDRFDEARVFDLLEHKLPFVNLLRNDGQFPSVETVVPLPDETGVVPVGAIVEVPERDGRKQFVSLMSDFGVHRLVKERIRIVRHSVNNEGALEPRQVVPLLQNEDVSELLVKIGIRGVGASIENTVDGKLTCALQPSSTIEVQSERRSIERDLFELLHQPCVIATAAQACRASNIDDQSICFAFPVHLQTGSLHIAAQAHHQLDGGIDLINELVAQGHVGNKRAAIRTYGLNSRSVLSAEMVLFKSFFFGRDDHTVIIGPFRCRKESDNNFRLATQPIPAITDHVVTNTMRMTQTILLDQLRSLEPPGCITRFVFLTLNKLIYNIQPPTRTDHLVVMRCLLEAAAPRFECSDNRRKTIALTHRYCAWFRRILEPKDTTLDHNAARCNDLLRILLFRMLPLHKRFILQEVLLAGCLGTSTLMVMVLFLHIFVFKKL